MEIDPEVKIPKKSKVSISSSGVMGEKFINFLPKVDNGEYLENGAYLYGVDEAGMDAMFDSMTKVMEEVEVLLKTVQAIVGDDVFKQSVIEMSANMKESTSHINNMTGTFEKLATDNEEVFNNMIQAMNGAVENMNQTMANVEHMTANSRATRRRPKI